MEITMTQQLQEPLKKFRESISTLRHEKTRYEQRYEEQKLISLLATNETEINKIKI
jgi:hypothetical protein